MFVYKKVFLHNTNFDTSQRDRGSPDSAHKERNNDGDSRELHNEWNSAVSSGWKMGKLSGTRSEGNLNGTTRTYLWACYTVSTHIITCDAGQRGPIGVKTAINTL